MGRIAFKNDTVDNQVSDAARQAYLVAVIGVTAVFTDPQLAVFRKICRHLSYLPPTTKAYHSYYVQGFLVKCHKVRIHGSGLVGGD